jgi:hypothetical protein
MLDPSLFRLAQQRHIEIGQEAERRRRANESRRFYQRRVPNSSRAARLSIGQLCRRLIANMRRQIASA